MAVCEGEDSDVPSSQAWPSLVGKPGLQACRGTWSTAAGPVICPRGPTCNTLQTWFISLSLGRGGHYTNVLLGMAAAKYSISSTAHGTATVV